ncbi:SDR family oxidoreductase [Aureimonas fodinaquatilis]|uniref:SDR family oxidoreductase n=1 Tax=Aureimonas fodinaquatilis TaxID=2565783 RepID=A0A5B0DTH5_9HYPH|nr:SDR family oxidoreductase [Aureimonas fodinaquatilis]KAA0969071.1 SDR family oxidoreductase [Aureimonas fodinaquatilis]
MPSENKAKTLVITGGAGDIGGALITGFLAKHYQVIAVDRDQARLDALEKRDGLHTVAIDITQEDKVAELFEKTVPQIVGELGVLINGAGVMVRATPHETTFEEWRRVMSVNLDAAFLCARGAGRLMLQQGYGNIINIASMAGIKALDRRVAYCTSKAGIAHMTRVQALEWGNLGIRVNAIAPGFILGSMNADLRKDPRRYEAMNSQVPMNRFGQPEELVGPALFLASDESSYINGHVLAVDGGLLVT